MAQPGGIQGVLTDQQKMGFLQMMAQVMGLNFPVPDATQPSSFPGAQPHVVPTDAQQQQVGTPGVGDAAVGSPSQAQQQRAPTPDSLRALLLSRPK